MATEMISLRLDPETRARLERTAQSEGASRTSLVTRYIEEGLRMDAHPGIVFRPGPAGRRPGLPGGPDVWEVARVLRNSEARDQGALTVAAEWLGLSIDQVRVALDYYAEYRDEIDTWLERIDEQALQAEAAWRRQQDLLQ